MTMSPDTFKAVENYERRRRADGTSPSLGGGRITARRDGQTVFDSRAADGGEFVDDGDDGETNARRAYRTVDDLDPARIYARFNKKE